MAQKPARKKIFISYSHKDETYLSRLLTHLRPHERQNPIEVWVDTKIKSGGDWLKEIKQAISEARVAILLVSADFLASDFIATEELPPLLRRAEENGVTIIPVIIKPCMFDAIPELARFQAINTPQQPLNSLDEAHAEFMWVKVTQAVKEAISTPHSMNTPKQNHNYTYTAETMLSEVIKNPYVVNSYFTYYTHSPIDMLDFIPDAETLLQDIPNKDEILDQVHHVLLKAGWEGDGEIGLIWIPPFMLPTDSFGTCIWHVKQSNNGTSFLASPMQLPKDELEVLYIPF